MRRLTHRAVNLRSRVSNGALYFTLRNSGSPSARRLRDLIALHISDCGGVEDCSTAELLLIRRAAQLALQLELLEEHFALRPLGEAPTKKLETYQRCTNTLRRVLETLHPRARKLGLRRRARDVTPTLDQYLAVKKQQEVAE